MLNKGDEKRKEILDYLTDFLKNHNYPPSVREIADAVGLRSTASVHRHLSILQEKRLIKRNPYNSRAIEVVGQNDDLTDKQHDADKIDIDNNIEMIQLPIIGSVAAGTPILAVENIEDYFPIPSSYAPSGTLFMLKVRGDSMIEVGINDGDLIMVRQQPSAENGEIVVALIDDSATVKTLYRKDGHIVLQPENSSMEAFIADDAQILGKVFGVYRFLK